jgi:prepilin-type N-terminal cleavage/methylation domain-containing protein
MARRDRRAFTLIELLVVLAIVAMVLALAAPAIMSILKTTSIGAATDILRSAVSTTRSTAVSSRKSCSVDIRNVVHPDGRVLTESVSTSAILTVDDFEPYDDDEAENELEFRENWDFFPRQDTWEIYSQRTRELWVGRKADNSNVNPYSGNAYAWNIGARTSDEPGIDVETMVLARFRARQVTDDDGVWGFGLLSNFSSSDRQSSGYRFAVRVDVSDSGWNTYSRAQLEKVRGPSSASGDSSYEATDVDSSDDIMAVRDLDWPHDEVSSALTPGVWYWMKMRMNRVQKVVTVAGKVWVDGAPEPASWTVGPMHDRWDDSDAPITIPDNFGSGGDPFAGGFYGVWTRGAELAVDDFSVDWRNTWLLPKGIHMQPKTYDPGHAHADSFGLVPLERYEPGSFPLTYRPDGTAASDRSVLLVITNTASSDRRAIQIDRNTGRVEAADSLTIAQ